MLKRLLIFLLVLLGLFYVISGIYFYRKSFRKKNSTVKSEIDSTFKFNAADLVIMKEVLVNFEDAGDGNKFSLSTDYSNSGRNSVKLLPENEFGAEIHQSFSEIPSLSQFRQVEITLKIRNTKVTTEGTLWILEINSEDGKVLTWHPEELPSSLNKWETYTFRFDINPVFLKNFNRIKTYAWNRSKNTCYIDDIKIRFLGLPQENVTALFKPLNPSSFFFDLENDSSLENTGTLTDELAHSGKRSSYINGNNEYSASAFRILGNVMNDTIKTIFASAWLYPLSDRPECTLVVEVRNSDEEQVYWNGKSTAKMNLKAGSWQKLNAAFNIAPEDYRKFSKDDIIYVYVLNNSRSKLYADDFEISYGTTPELRGTQVYVDMNTLDDRAYQFNRYHPPFPVSSLVKKEINNNNSDYLIKSDSLKHGLLLPDQFITAGFFSGNSSGNEELLVVTVNTIELYQFCDKKERFVVSGKTSINSIDFKNAIIISGDYNNDGRNELLVTQGSVSRMYNFSTPSKQSCLDNLQGMKMNMLWSGSLHSGNFEVLSGKFSGAKQDELFLADSTGICTLIRFEGKSWNVLASDSLSKHIFGKNSTQVCGKFFSTKNDEILSVYQEYNQTQCVLLEVKNGRINSRPFPGQENVNNFFSPDDILFRIPSKANQYDEIFSFNNRWRFEMKRLNIDKEGFYISSVPEFKGYMNDQNPKYYEFPKLITGKFTGNETSILCVLRNCADKTFDGYPCKKYDSIPDLPNSIQLYMISKKL